MLTLSQQRTYNFVAAFINEEGYAPTVAEIAKGIGIRSRGVVYRYLKAIAAVGLIELIPHRHRNIQLVDNSSSSQPRPKQAIPLVGTIAAGLPIEAISEAEMIDVAQVFFGEQRFALRVKGDSMKDEGILDGDTVVCEKTDTALEGQIVVALIDHQEATLKKIQLNGDDTITLVPANVNIRSMTYAAHRVIVQGVFIGLLRLNAKRIFEIEGG